MELGTDVGELGFQGGNNYLCALRQGLGLTVRVWGSGALLLGFRGSGFGGFGGPACVFELSTSKRLQLQSSEQN